MKKKLQLQTVVNLKKDLIRDISESQKDIIRYANSERKIDTDLEKLEKKEEQLLIIKEVIQKANRGKNSEGKTNNYFIFRNYNLNARRIMLEELIDKYDKKNSQLSKENLEKQLSETLTELEKIASLLKTFNRDTKVTVDLDESLNLLNE